jgi:hypothetical protein
MHIPTNYGRSFHVAQVMLKTAVNAQVFFAHASKVGARQGLALTQIAAYDHAVERRLERRRDYLRIAVSSGSRTPDARSGPWLTGRDSQHDACKWDRPGARSRPKDTNLTGASNTPPCSNGLRTATNGHGEHNNG